MRDAHTKLQALCHGRNHRQINCADSQTDRQAERQTGRQTDWHYQTAMLCGAVQQQTERLASGVRAHLRQSSPQGRRVR